MEEASHKQHQQANNSNNDDIFMGEKHLDRRWAWVVMIAALLTHILTFGAAYASVGALYVEFLNAFGQSESATALTGSILLGTMLCTGPLASILVGRFGARAVAIIGGVFSVAGLISSAFARGLVHLYFTFGFLTGLGYGLSYLPCIVMVGNFFEKKRTLAGGIAVSGSGLGTFIVAPITQGLLDAFGYRKALIILGGIELILCICGATYVPSKIPVRKIEINRDDNESELESGTGSILTASALESTNALTKPSDVSFLMQAAMCSSGLSFSTSQPRPHSSMARDEATNTSVDFAPGSPMPQLSASLATSSVLAQAALGAGGFSPSISSSVVLSSSKISEHNMISPAVASSPITPIPDEWLESVAQTLKIEDNDKTLVARRKPDMPSLPDEFTGGGSTCTIKAPDRDSCATIVIAQGPNPSNEETDVIGARAIAAKIMEESAQELVDSSDYKAYLSPSSDKNAQPLQIFNGTIQLGASYSSNTSNKYHDPSIFSSVDDVIIPDHPVDNINDLIIPQMQINGFSADIIGKIDDERQDQPDAYDVNSFTSSATFQNTEISSDSKTVLEQLLTIINLFKNRFFIFFCISNLFVCVAYQLPYMYFKAFALSMGLGEESWVLILSVMGITNTLGRVLVGFAFNYVHTNSGRLYGFAFSYIISGIILTMTSLANSYVTLLCYATAFALVAGSTDSLVAALLVGFVGLETLGYSFGMTIEMQGIGFVIGPPIAGFMFSLTGTYTAIFFTGGVAFVISGFVLLLEPLIAYIRNENQVDDIQLNRL